MSINAEFTPRREFLKQERSTSSFALLSFSGAAFIRLSNFPTTVVQALRKSLEPTRSFRQDTTQNLCEITLEGKPWAQPKSLDTERLVVEIFAVILSNGFTLLTSIDYGRENDDKLCLVFSKLNSSVAPTGSDLWINNQIPFAVSFPSTTSLRVIAAPLHSTPAILQALRTAWPRGISGERKLAEGSYEFKLKGYSILREDTFPTDSLAHILNLLSSLDNHGFTLLTSISVSGNHSRVKDLWIFSGLDEGSSLSSLNASSQRITSAPTIPPVLPSPPQSIEGEGLAAATLPLWEQFSADNTFHQRAATAPNPDHGSNEDINIASSHTRIQSERLVNSESSAQAAKQAVLRKKPPPERRDKSGSSPMRNNLVLAEEGRLGGSVDELADQHVSTSPETPARVLYSTPRHDQLPVPAAYSSPVSTEDIRPVEPTTEPTAPSASHALPNELSVAAIENGGIGEYQDKPESNPVTQDQPNAILTQPEALSPEYNQPSSRGQLLGSTIFRDTLLTESSNPSSNSIPQVSVLPILWADANKEQPVNGLAVESPEREGQVTPKQPSVTLPQQELPVAPPMAHRDTQASMPHFPGGWTSTPAQEVPPKQVESSDPPQNAELPDMASNRSSNYGIIGSVEPVALVSPEKPIVEEGLREVHKSPQDVLAQEESKVLLTFDEQRVEQDGIAPPTSELEPAEHLDAVNSPPHHAEPSKPPSAFKRLFNRTTRRNSKIQGEAGVAKSLSLDQEEKLDKEKRRAMLQSKKRIEN